MPASTVMVVTGRPEVAARLTKMLSKADVRTTTAVDCAGALTGSANIPPNAFVLDMDIECSEQVLQVLRRTAPVIVYCARKPCGSSDRRLICALRQGAIDYIQAQRVGWSEAARLVSTLANLASKVGILEASKATAARSLQISKRLEQEMDRQIQPIHVSNGAYAS